MSPNCTSLSACIANTTKQLIDMIVKATEHQGAELKLPHAAIRLKYRGRYLEKGSTLGEQGIDHAGSTVFIVKTWHQMDLVLEVYDFSIYDAKGKAFTGKEVVEDMLDFDPKTGFLKGLCPNEARKLKDADKESDPEKIKALKAADKEVAKVGKLFKPELQHKFVAREEATKKKGADCLASNYFKLATVSGSEYWNGLESKSKKPGDPDEIDFNIGPTDDAWNSDEESNPLYLKGAYDGLQVGEVMQANLAFVFQNAIEEAVNRNKKTIQLTFEVRTMIGTLVTRIPELQRCFDPEVRQHSLHAAASLKRGIMFIYRTFAVFGCRTCGRLSFQLSK